MFALDLRTLMSSYLQRVKSECEWERENKMFYLPRNRERWWWGEERSVCISKRTLILVGSSLNLIEWIRWREKRRKRERAKQKKFRLDIIIFIWQEKDERTSEWNKLARVCAKRQEISIGEYLVNIEFREQMSIFSEQDSIRSTWKGILIDSSFLLLEEELIFSDRFWRKTTK